MADIVMSDAKYVERPKVLLLAPFSLALHLLSTHWHLSEGVCTGSEHPVSSLLQHGSLQAAKGPCMQGPGAEQEHGVAGGGHQHPASQAEEQGAAGEAAGRGAGPEAECSAVPPRDGAQGRQQQR